MDFNEYQRKIQQFDTFSYEKFIADGGKVSNLGVVGKALGLAGESGEVCDKIKKIIRDKNGEASETDKTEVIKEMGDVLWYLAMLARYLGTDFEKVTALNIEKLTDRQKRNKIHGAGDNR